MGPIRADARRPRLPGALPETQDRPADVELAVRDGPVLYDGGRRATTVTVRFFSSDDTISKPAAFNSRSSVRGVMP